ncbi:MAG: STAS domain-containing protein [Anaerolineae bacterium]
MNLTTEEFKNCTLVRVEGRIDSQTAPRLETVLKSIMDKGQYKIVLDMSAVEFTSSAGLRVLVSAQKKCKQLNRGEIVLAAVPERIQEALDLAGLIPIFRITEDVVHAVGNI